MAEACAQERDQRRELRVVECTAKSRHYFACFALAGMDAVEGHPDQVGGRSVGHRGAIGECDAATPFVVTIGAGGAIDRVAIVAVTGIGWRVLAARRCTPTGRALPTWSIAGGGRARA